MTKNIILTCPLLVVTVLASACSQPRVHGAAVRSVMNSQIYNFDAALNPDPNAVEGSDPYHLDAALNAYREDVANPQEVRRPLIIGIGNQSR